MAVCVVGNVSNLFGKVIHLTIDKEPDMRSARGRKSVSIQVAASYPGVPGTSAQVP